MPSSSGRSGAPWAWGGGRVLGLQHDACPNSARTCTAAGWSTGGLIQGVSICSRVCDPVSPQNPKSPLRTCPTGFGCYPTSSGAGTSCASDDDCMPGTYCNSPTGGVCAKYCYAATDCPGTQSCVHFSSSVFAGRSEVGVCLGGSGGGSGGSSGTSNDASVDAPSTGAASTIYHLLNKGFPCGPTGAFFITPSGLIASLSEGGSTSTLAHGESVDFAVPLGATRSFSVQCCSSSSFCTTSIVKSTCSSEGCCSASSTLLLSGDGSAEQTVGVCPNLPF